MPEVWVRRRSRVNKRERDVYHDDKAREFEKRDEVRRALWAVQIWDKKSFVPRETDRVAMKPNHTSSEIHRVLQMEKKMEELEAGLNTSERKVIMLEVKVSVLEEEKNSPRRRIG